MTRKQQFLHDLAGQVARMVSLEQKEILTVDEAAEYAGVEKNTIQKYCSAGKIAFSKPEGKVYIDRKDLIEWMKSRRTESITGLERLALKRKAS